MDVKNGQVFEKRRKSNTFAAFFIVKKNYLMPYIKIKSFPKDPKIKQQVVEAINETFLKYWGCPQEAISISMEEVEPQHWDEVEQNEIQPNADKMFIQNGVKKY